MAIFRYIAFNKKGKHEKGIIDAPNMQAARRVLKSRGLYVKTLAEDTEKRERELFPFLTKLLYRVPRRDVGLFVRQLGTLLNAGLPLDRSLSNIVDQIENEFLKKAIIEIRASVVEGTNLSDAMKKHPAIFPPLYYNLISVGEKTGAYEQSLLRLADLEQANEALKNKVMSALLYPIIMLVMLGGILIFLLAVVFPQIKTLFVQMDAKLPLITVIVLEVSNLITSWKILIVIAIVSGLIFYFKKWKDTPEGQIRYEKFKFDLPFLGHFFKKIILTKFARNLGVMLENRVPLITALQVVSSVVENKIFENELNNAIKMIKEGSKLTDAFRESEVVNQMLMGMLSAGEASDTIPDMVMRIADVLDDDVDSYVQRLSTLLEPVMIVIMGSVIIIIMSAILLPMFALTEQMRL